MDMHVDSYLFSAKRSVNGIGTSRSKQKVVYHCGEHESSLSFSLSFSLSLSLSRSFSLSLSLSLALSLTLPLPPPPSLPPPSLPPSLPLSQAVKKPKSVYWYLQLLVGVHYDNPIVEQYRKWFPYYDIQKDEERGKKCLCFEMHTIQTVS